MKSAAVFERYAEALYQVAEKQGETQRIVQEAEQLLGILGSNARLMDLLRSPRIPNEQRKEFIRSALRSASPLLLRMLFLLVDKHRIGYLSQILFLFQREYDRQRGMLPARFIIAKPVDLEITSRMKERLEQRLGGTVVLKVILDEAILGGFIFITETLLIDASIRRQLSEIEAYLSSSS